MMPEWQHSLKISKSAGVQLSLVAHDIAKTLLYIYYKPQFNQSTKSDLILSAEAGVLHPILSFTVTANLIPLFYFLLLSFCFYFRFSLILILNTSYISFNQSFAF